MACPNQRFSVAEFHADPLRVRWMDPTQGRFLGLDAYAGNQLNPISFNKYLYCHADPVNNVDPTGRMAIAVSIGSVGFRVAVVGVVSAAAIVAFTQFSPFQGARNFIMARLSFTPYRAAAGEWQPYYYLVHMLKDFDPINDIDFTDLGCVGLLRLRLGLASSTPVDTALYPFKEVAGTRGFTNEDDAKATYAQMLQQGKTPWLYMVQVNQNLPVAALLPGAATEIDVMTMPVFRGNDFNFASKIFLKNGNETWEDMPVGKTAAALDTEGRKNVVTRHTDILRNYGPTVFRNYFFVSPTRSSRFYEE